jgi:pantoate--beta-alanine ligase
MVINQLKNIMKLDGLTVVICPTLREQDGLAMSSRNRRLTEPQRTIAGLIYQCLVSIEAKKSSGNFGVVKKECLELLEKKGFVPEYVALANANDLRLMDEYEERTPMVALIAVKIGDIRLIDNMLL